MEYLILVLIVIGLYSLIKVYNWYYNKKNVGYFDKAKKLLMLAMVIGLLVSVNVWAGDCERCGSRIVCPGLTKWEVIQICGKPDYSEKYFTNGEKFIYNTGSSSFVRIFEFQGGILLNISTSGYGWSK